MLMRSRVAESRAQPVTNLATNPSFETAAAGSTVVRRNLSPASVPFSDSVAISAFGTGGFTNPTISTPTDGPTVNGVRLAWRKVTATADAPSTSVAIYSNQGAALPLGMTAVTPGRTITASIYGATSITGASTSMRIRWFDSSYAAVSSAPNLDPWVSVGGTFRRFSSTAVVPANAAFASVDFFINTRNWLTGDWFGATGVLVEERPALLPFFNGSLGTVNGIAYSFEGTANMSPSVAKAAVVEVRRNLSPNPSARSATQAGTIGGGNSGGSVAQATTFGRTDTTSWAYTAGATPGGDKGPQVTLGGLVVGTIYTVSAYVYASGLFTSSGIRGGVYQGSWLGTSAWSTVVGAWTRLSFTFTAVGTTGSFVIGAPMISNQAGVDFYVDDILIEASPTLSPYFDGNTTPDADLAPSWLFGADASSSVLSGVALFGVTAPDAGRTPYRSWLWSSRGACSLRVPTYTTQDSFASIVGGILPIAQMRGKTYTVLGRIRITATQTGTLHGYARYFRAQADGAELIAANNPAAAPNVPGEYVVRATFTIPAAAIYFPWVRLYNGAAAGNADVWWDELAIVEGVYTGPYLDGDMPNCVWRGTPHASRSVGYPPSA